MVHGALSWGMPERRAGRAGGCCLHWGCSPLSGPIKETAMNHLHLDLNLDKHLDATLVIECPVCGHGELQRREPNAIEQFMLKLGRVFQN